METKLGATLKFIFIKIMHYDNNEFADLTKEERFLMKLFEDVSYLNNRMHKDVIVKDVINFMNAYNVAFWLSEHVMKQLGKIQWREIHLPFNEVYVNDVIDLIKVIIGYKKFEWVDLYVSDGKKCNKRNNAGKIKYTFKVNELVVARYGKIKFQEIDDKNEFVDENELSNTNEYWFNVYMYPFDDVNVMPNKIRVFNDSFKFHHYKLFNITEHEDSRNVLICVLEYNNSLTDNSLYYIKHLYNQNELNMNFRLKKYLSLFNITCEHL